MEAKRYTAHGETHTLREWSAILGVPESTLRYRLVRYGRAKDGMSVVFASDRMIHLRHATLVTHEGMTKTLKEWAEYAGLKPSTFRARLAQGYSFSEALRKEPKYTQAEKARMFGGKMVTVDGVTENIAAHCRRIGISVNTVRMRMRKGADAISAITDPIMQEEQQREGMLAKRWEKYRRDQAAALGIVI